MPEQLPTTPWESPDTALAQRQLRTHRAVMLITDAGKTLLQNGGEVFRAQQTMEIMAKALGVPGFHCYVITNAIFVSADGALHEIRYIPTTAMHLARVEAVNALSRRLAAGGVPLEQAEEALARAAALPDPDPRLQFLAGVGGAAGFAFLFGGAWAEMLLAAAAGAAELGAQVLLHRVGHGRVSRLFSIVMASAAGALLSMLCGAFLPVDSDIANIGALMILTPGVSLTTAVRDLVNADYLSGTIRLFDALLVAGSIACGVGIAWLIMHGWGVAV